GHHAFEHHAGIEIRQAFNTFLELRGLEFRARVAAGLFELGKDVLNSGQAEAFIHKFAGRHALERIAIADGLAHVGLDRGEDAFDQGVGLRVHGGRVERVIAIRNAQEPRGLFERLFTEARYLLERVAAGEGAVAVAPGNDVARQTAGQAGYS